jgi:hypothetical protein
MDNVLIMGLVVFGVFLLAKFMVFLTAPKNRSTPQSTEEVTILNPDATKPCPPHTWTPQPVPEGADSDKFYGLYCKRCPARYPGLT